MKKIFCGGAVVRRPSGKNCKKGHGDGEQNWQSTENAAPIYTCLKSARLSPSINLYEQYLRQCFEPGCYSREMSGVDLDPMMTKWPFFRRREICDSIT